MQYYFVISCVFYGTFVDNKTLLKYHLAYLSSLVILCFPSKFIQIIVCLNVQIHSVQFVHYKDPYHVEYSLRNIAVEADKATSQLLEYWVYSISTFDICELLI